MVTTTAGKRMIARRITSGAQTYPLFVAIGSGSGAVLVSDTNLVAQTGSNTFTSTDISTALEATWVTDYASTTMSGTNLREFGLKDNAGSLWQREGFAAVTFDGTNELQIQITFKVY